MIWRLVKTKKRVLTLTILIALLSSFFCVCSSSGISAQNPPTPTGNFTARFNPTGTHIHKGFLKIRIDLYPGVGSKCYSKYHVYVPVFPPEGYPGEVDKDGNPIDEQDYNRWVDSLPHVWQLNPCLSHFIAIEETTQPSDLMDFLNLKLNPDVIKTLDDSLILPNSAHLVSPLMRDRARLTDQKVTTKDFEDLINSVNLRFASLQTSPESGEGLIIEPQTIDIGTAAIDRSATWIAGFTFIALSNAANDTGTIDTVEVWADVNMTGFKAGTEFLVSGSTYECRDVESIGNVTAGSKQTFSGLDMDVTTGDFLACYYGEGKIERDGSGGSGTAYDGGDQLTATNQAVFNDTTYYDEDISLYGTGTESGGVAAPTVVTNAASNVEETTATASGNITATSENCTSRGFEWDTDSGAPYTDNWTENGSFGVGNFTHGLTGLTKGELYYLRAMAYNSGGWGYGSEVTFLTKPDPATSFVSTDNGTTWISVSWVNGTGMDYAEIRYSDTSYPTDNVSGSAGYWGTGTSANITGLSANTTYYFTIFTHATEGGVWSTSDNNPSCQDTTDSGVSAPSVTTNAATNVEESTATISGNVTDVGGENVTRGFQWDTDLALPFSENWTEGTFGTGVYSHNLTGLNKGDKYAFRATANNTAGYGYGSVLYFMTKPDPATSFNVTDNGTVWLALGWINNSGADYAEVRYATGSAPTDNTSGTLGYWGNGTTANVTGLDMNTTYFFQIFTHAFEDSTWSSADGAVTCQGTTDVGVPSVTGSAATGVTNTDATLNGTITDDGGDSCNVTWQWGVTDEGQAFTWDSSANQTGESAGAISYPISGTLAPSTLYYWIVRVINTAGTDWSVSGNFTTTNITAVYPPDPFILTDLGATTIGADWTNGANAVYAIIRISHSYYPTSTTDGEEFYRGVLTSYNGTGYDLHGQWFLSAWGVGTDNTTVSGDYTTGTIGGVMALFYILAGLAGVLTVAMFASKQVMLGFPCAIFWFILGGYCYQQSTATWDIYYLVFFASMGMGVFSMYAAYALRTKKEEAQEGDLYFDEGGDKDVKFIDEGGGRDNDTGLDDDKPRRSARAIRERAERRRQRWD